GRTACDQHADDVPDLAAAPRVEARRRLVEEQQIGCAQHACRDVQPTAHAARVRLDLPVRSLLDVERGEQLGGAYRCLGAREAQQATKDAQVLASREVLVDRCELTRQADATTYRLRLAHQVVSEHTRTTRIRPQQRREKTHRRRLPRTVRPEQDVDAATSDAQSDSVDGSCGPKRLYETDGLDRMIVRHQG